jgi:tetratricopeptide (TPR) repeat protein
LTPKKSIIPRMPAIFFILTATSSLGATLKPGPAQFATINRAVDLVFTDSFDAATALISRYNDTIAGQPIYHLLQASILYARRMDSEDYSREREFMTNVNRSIDALDKWIDKNPDDAWAYFLWGSAYGYKAVWQGQKGDWLKSLLSGLKAKSRFFDALGLDSTLYDSYTGTGSYHYWSTVKLRKFLPFVADNRDEGLRELKIAMDSSLISSKAAGFGYGWALLNEHRYYDALKIANHLEGETHGGRSSLWLLGAIYWANGNLRKAEESYGMLIRSLEQVGNQNFFNLIYCRYRKGVCEYDLHDYKSAKFEFDALMAYDPPKSVRERHSQTYLRAKDYLKKIKAHGIQPE